jgi:hypothetical protein
MAAYKCQKCGNELMDNDARCDCRSSEGNLTNDVPDIIVDAAEAIATSGQRVPKNIAVEKIVSGGGGEFSGAGATAHLDDIAVPAAGIMDGMGDIAGGAIEGIGNLASGAMEGISTVAGVAGDAAVVVVEGIGTVIAAAFD